MKTALLTASILLATTPLASASCSLIRDTAKRATCYAAEGKPAACSLIRDTAQRAFCNALKGRR